MAEKKEDATVDVTRKLADKVAEKADRIKYLVLAALAMLIVAGLVIGWVRSSGKARDAAANDALFKAGMDGVGKTPEEFAPILKKVAVDYAGLPAAEQALIFEFTALYYSGKYKEAEEPLRTHMKDFPASAFAPKVRLALGQTLLQQGDFAGAKRELQPLLAGPASVMPEARLAYAQALEREAEAAKDDKAEYANRLERAREAYFEIVNQAQTRTSLWPQGVVQSAEFALLMMDDKLAGYEYRNPLRPAPAERTEFVTVEEPPVPGEPHSPDDGHDHGDDAAPEASAPPETDVGTVRPPASGSEPDGESAAE